MHTVTTDEEQKMASYAIHHTEWIVVYTLHHQLYCVNCESYEVPSGSRNDTSLLLRLDSSTSFHIGPSLWFGLLSALSEIA